MKLFIIVFVIILVLSLLLLLPFVPFTFRLKADKKTETSFKIFGKTLRKKDKKNTKDKKPDILKLIKFIFSERSVMFETLKYLLKKSSVNDFKLHIVSSCDDAAETALLYGGICAVIYPAVAFLETVIPVKKDDIKISCDYENNCPSLFLLINIRVSVFSLLKAYFKVSTILKRK